LCEAIQKAQQIAKATVPVLLLGETGVGKELFARGIRQAGAKADGPFVAPNFGTLFLDEIGEMPLDIQPHLLRVLEESEVLRLAEDASRKVNFHLIAAIHRDLPAEIAGGNFRTDLYYRLDTMTLVEQGLACRKEFDSSARCEKRVFACVSYGDRSIF